MAYVSYQRSSPVFRTHRSMSEENIQKLYSKRNQRLFCKQKTSCQMGCRCTSTLNLLFIRNARMLHDAHLIQWEKQCIESA